jgi:hypothetical protein
VRPRVDGRTAARGSQDALHLATLELLGEPPSLITVVTRDDRVRANAAAIGYVIE